MVLLCISPVYLPQSVSYSLHLSLTHYTKPTQKSEHMTPSYYRAYKLSTCWID